MHLTAPLTNAGINAWITRALSLAAEAATREPGSDITDLTDTIQAEYDAIPDALKPQAMESLRQRAAHGNDASERVAALRVLDLMVTA